jgi:hypothetical protein
MGRRIVAKPSRAAAQRGKGRGELFSFQVRVTQDLDTPVPLKAGFALLQCSVRHMADHEVDIVPQVAGKLNVGARIFSDDKQKMIFETRLFSQPKILAPRAWTPVQISIPQEQVTTGVSCLLNIDFVREHEFWFADKGGTAYEHRIVFGTGATGYDIFERLAAVEKAVAALRGEFDAFQVQVPRLLNAVSASNAAASIVGRVRAALDRDEAQAGLPLQRLSLEIEALWQAYDNIAQVLDASTSGAALAQSAAKDRRPKSIAR